MLSHHQQKWELMIKLSSIAENKVKFLYLYTTSCSGNPNRWQRFLDVTCEHWQNKQVEIFKKNL